MTPASFHKAANHPEQSRSLTQALVDDVCKAGRQSSDTGGPRPTKPSLMDGTALNRLVVTVLLSTNNRTGPLPRDPEKASILD